MGNIITLSPGDLVDRQTILQLKLSHAGIESDTGYAPVSQQILEQSTSKAVNRTVLLDKSKIDIQPFLVEHEAIQSRLELDWFPKLDEKNGSIFDKLMEDLKSINSELWRLEDQARVLRSAPDKFLDTVTRRKAETLDAITYHNEQRANLVRKINTLWNIDVPEKMYV